MILRGKNKGKSNTFTIVSLLLLVSLALYFLVLEPLVFNKTVYKDYGSAGAYIREQMAQSKSPIKFTCNTTEYNMIVGTKYVVEHILIETVVHTGVPAEGDHLCFRIGEVISNSSKKELKDGSDDITFSFNVNYRTTAKQEEELAAKAAEILSSLNIDGASDYDKVLAIYNYICRNVTYDYEHLEDGSYKMKDTAYGTAYAAAINNTAVCAGIADLFYYLANSAGLDARIDTNSNHAWNFVKVDGKYYYYIDATWDLGKSEDEYEFFLKGWADFEYHMGNIDFGPDEYINYLNHSDLGYDFSDYAYGYDPYPLLKTP